MSTNELREAMQINVAEKLEETRQAIAFLRGIGTDVPVEAIELLHIMERCVAAESRISSEHPPDDDTPIDEAWLRSIGMRPLSETCPIWQIRERYGRLIEAWETEDGWKADVQVESKFPINFPTRGQLRRLCEALGVELKENK